MAKKFELHERGTDEVIYPVTLSECTYHDGVSLDKVIDNKAEKDELSNVFAEEVVDNDDYEEFDKLTREDLKKDLFIDMWNKACGDYGTYNKSTGYFELNGLTDITYEEALTIYIETYAISRGVSKTNNGKPWVGYVNLNCRTNIPVILNGNSGYIVNGYLMSMEVVNVVSAYKSKVGANLIIYGESIDWYGCDRCHTIIGIIALANSNIYNSANQNMRGLLGLQNAKFERLSTNFYMGPCSKFSLESFNYMIEHATNTVPITITVHSGIYNALIGEDTTYPFNGGTKEEWLQLAQDAINKQITFATV